jgi:hypothetical protein
MRRASHGAGLASCTRRGFPADECLRPKSAVSLEEDKAGGRVTITQIAALTPAGRTCQGIDRAEVRGTGARRAERTGPCVEGAQRRDHHGLHHPGLIALRPAKKGGLAVPPFCSPSDGALSAATSRPSCRCRRWPDRPRRLLEPVAVCVATLEEALFNSALGGCISSRGTRAALRDHLVGAFDPADAFRAVLCAACRRVLVSPCQCVESGLVDRRSCLRITPAVVDSGQDSHTLASVSGGALTS